MLKILNLKRNPFSHNARSKNKCKVQVGPVHINREVLTSERDMVTAFNDYFVSVFTSEDISTIPTLVLMTSEPSHVDLSDIDFTVQDVSNALFKLRIDKAAGADDLSPRFMLQLKDYTAYPLYLLFRKSLDEGSVPADWKCANISPIYNKRSK